MKPWLGWALAGGGVLAVGAAVVAAKSASASTSATPGSTGLVYNLVSGHKYEFTVTSPSALSLTPTVALAQVAMPGTTVTNVSTSGQVVTIDATAISNAVVAAQGLAIAIGADPGSTVTMVDTTTASATKSGNAFGGSVPKQLSANYNSNGTTLAMNVGDSLKTSLLMTGGQPWTFANTNPSVLAMPTMNSTATDPNVPGGTDQVDSWAAIGEGTAVISGTSGTQTWKMTINVSTA